MNVLIFGGTTEGRILSEALRDRGDEVTVCVATDYGREEQEQVTGVTVLTGRKGPEEMRALLPQYDRCIDATHPYATEVTSNLRQIAEETGVPYVRVCRDLSQNTDADALPEGVQTFFGLEQLASYLKSTEGNILLATGTKELPAFRDLSPDRLFPRVLPSVENLTACEAMGIPRRNIIAMQGPFTTELNEAILHQKDIAYFVTKNGGATGGFPEKLEAAKNAGVPLLVLLPPEEDGMTVEEYLEALE